MTDKPTDTTHTAHLLQQILNAGTATRYDLLDGALRQAEQRGATRERARIRQEVQQVSSEFIQSLARYQ